MGAGRRRQLVFERRALFSNHAQHADSGQIRYFQEFWCCICTAGTIWEVVDGWLLPFGCWPAGATGSAQFSRRRGWPFLPICSSYILKNILKCISPPCGQFMLLKWHRAGLARLAMTMSNANRVACAAARWSRQKIYYPDVSEWPLNGWDRLICCSAAIVAIRCHGEQHGGGLRRWISRRQSNWRDSDWHIASLKTAVSGI